MAARRSAHHSLGTDQAWLEGFARVTREELLAVLPRARSSCVLSTRLGLDVLQYFGVAAKPQAVTVRVCTLDYATTLLHRTDNDGVGHGIGYMTGVYGSDEVTTGPDGRASWNGHLVIRLSAQPRLIDLSADQFDEPDHGLCVPGPLVTPSFDPEAWDHGEPVLFDTEHGAMLTYQRMTSQTWRQALDWRGSPREVRGLVAAVIRRLR